MIKLFLKKTEKITAQQQSQEGHRLLCNKIAEYYGVDADSITVSKDNRGAPFIPGLPQLKVSLTHTDGMVACAFSLCDIGIDVEKIKNRRESVERRVFNAEEIELIEKSDNPDKAFFILWTLKESYLKAMGTGFADNAKSISFSKIEGDINSDHPECSFSCKETDGYIISVCEIKS